MRVTSREPGEEGRERLTLVPETIDDLWHLTYIIEPGDLVDGDTSRRIQRRDDTIRDTGGEREHIWVRLRVEEVSFHRFANRVRVAGEIVDASREDQLGFHHTLNLEIHDEFTLEKSLKPDQRQRLEEAVESSDRPSAAIVTVEEGLATVHTVAPYGTEEYATITGPTGKGEFARDRDELFAELTDVLGHLEVDAIVLSGPGFTKQDALDYLRERDPALAESIRTVDTSSAGDRGVHEVLKRGALEDIQIETRIAEEASLIDELTERIARDGAATYGIEGVSRAVEYGAVEELLVVDERLREERAGNGDWPIDADELLRTVEQQGGSVTVFSHEYDPGRQLHNLGDVAALLRYRLE